MLDTTFGNVKADLTYEEMIELVSGVKPGDMIKLRDDLEEWGVEYRVKSIEGAFGDNYTKQDSLYYGILENDCDDCSLKCKWGEVECQYDWIPYNMVDIDWLVAQRAKEETTENVTIQDNGELPSLSEMLKEMQSKFEGVVRETIETEAPYCASPVNQQQDFFKMANDLNSIVELEIIEAIEKLNRVIAKANAINRGVNIMLPNSTTYFGIQGAESEVEEDSKEIKIIIK